MDKQRVAAIVGPTAVGKTELSLKLADDLDAEIVSLDSMQLYRGMDIGTAKPRASEREAVAHHLIDVFEPAEEVTVAAFQELARGAIEEIRARGRLPLLVGGSGLYFRAVVDDLKFPPRDPELRSSLEAEADELGAETLHARLVGLDPQAAAKIEPGNARRTVRALEAIQLTGRPFSENDGWERYESIYDLRVAGLTRTRADVYQRIEERVRRMVAEGLVDEARALDDPSRTARQALGYRQIFEHPELAEADLIAEIVRATKRFARRQESWFRADPRVRWFEADEPDLVARVRARLGAVGAT